MHAVIHWWKRSVWARPLRFESRAEWWWTLGLLLPALALLVFCDQTKGNKKEHWSGQFERALEKRQPEQMPRWEQAGQFERLQMIFDARFSHPQELSSRQQIKAREYGKTRFWWIARGNACLLFVLWFARGWWMGPKGQLGSMSQPELEREIPQKPHARARAWAWWLGLGLIVATALSLQIPRLSLSLYNDEVMNFKEFIHGKYQGWEPGKELKFSQRRWERTAWDNRFGFNPVGFSTLTRWSYERWAEAADAQPTEVKEWVLRVPSLIGGLLVLVALALGLRAAGMPLAALLASGIWAIHPWAMRFASEGRPHGLMMGLAACLLVCMVAALRSGKWRAWLAVALLETLALWISAGALWLVFCLNVFVLGVLLYRAVKRQDGGWWQLRRFVVVTTLGSLLFFQLAGPSLPDFWMAVNREEDGGIIKPLKPNWWKDVGASLSTGRPYSDGHELPKGAPTWVESASWLKWMLWTWVGVLLSALLAGLWFSFGAKKKALVVQGVHLPSLKLFWGCALAVFLSAPLAYFMSWRGGTVLHSWYVVHLTIPLSLVLGVSLQLVWNAFARHSSFLAQKLGAVSCGGLVALAARR